MTTDELIRQYCEKMGITRAQYDAEGTLEQEQIDALLELAQSKDEDPIIPEGLPGAGKRRSELTDEESEHLSHCMVEFDEMCPGYFDDMPEDNDRIVGETLMGGWHARGWRIK